MKKILILISFNLLYCSNYNSLIKNFDSSIRIERASTELCSNTPKTSTNGTWSVCGSYIVIDSIEKLNNIRFRLDGKGYKNSPTADLDTSACPSTGCNGYILWKTLNFRDITSYENPNAKFDSTNYIIGSGSSQIKNHLNDSPRTSAGPSDFTQKGWEPIGLETTPFSATFDGNGYAITGMRIFWNLAGYKRNGFGLFGYISQTALIKDLGLNGDCAVYTMYRNTNVGALAGFNNGTIANSYATCHVFSNNGFNVGGLVGYNGTLGLINNTYATGSATTVYDLFRTEGGIQRGGANIGGLVGWNLGKINNSFATGLAPRLTEPAGFGVALQEDDQVNFVAGVSVAYSTTTHFPLKSCRKLDCRKDSAYRGNARVRNTLTYLGYRFVGGLVGVNDGIITNSFWNNGAAYGENIDSVITTLTYGDSSNREFRIRNPGQGLCCNLGGTPDKVIWQDDYISHDIILIHIPNPPNPAYSLEYNGNNVPYVYGPLGIGTGCVKIDCANGIDDYRFTSGKVIGVDNFDKGLTEANFKNITKTTALGDAFLRTNGFFPKLYISNSNSILVGGQ